MIRFLSSANHNLGLSKVRFIIDKVLYEYYTDACYVEKCERISRFSDKKALNYIKKHVVNTIKIKE